MAVASRQGHVTWAGHRTWYRVVGELEPDARKAPLVLLHGGPGGTHDVLEPIAELAESGRACVLYDQIGNGRSEHLRGAPAEFWQVQLFKDELDELLRALDISSRYHLLGQSWGGMLAMEHALERPAGLRSLVLCDSPASIPLWLEEADRLRAALPPDVQAVLDLHEREGTTDDPAYLEATFVFYRRHLCRLPVWPDCLERSFAAMAEDPTVYTTMWGPSEFTSTGILKDWDITDRIGEIELPTLILSGAYDEATPRVMEPVHQRIGRSRWEILEHSSHSPQLEQPEEFLALVGAFLDGVEAAEPLA
jgi:L-proline amide hydrolase